MLVPTTSLLTALAVLAAGGCALPLVSEAEIDQAVAYRDKLTPDARDTLAASLSDYTDPASGVQTQYESLLYPSTVSASAVRGCSASSTKTCPGLLPSIRAWIERL